MPNKTPTEEAVCEIRNGAMCLFAILMKVDQGKKTMVGAWYEMVVQDIRIRDALKIIKGEM